jgi:SWIM zinc finger
MTQTQQVGRPQKRGAGWFVPSGAVGYYVEWLSEGRWRCTCPSFRWRKTRTCKHIAAVARARKEVPMGQR